ncbi:hypothetical protein BDZ89DRAFT_1078411, partial [Hymenopellis radicata]
MAGVICRISSGVPFHGPFPGIDTLTPSHYLSRHISIIKQHPHHAPRPAGFTIDTRLDALYHPIRAQIFPQRRRARKWRQIRKQQRVRWRRGKSRRLSKGSAQNRVVFVRELVHLHAHLLLASRSSSWIHNRLFRCRLSYAQSFFPVLARNTHPRAVFQHLALHSHQHFPLPLLALILLPPFPTTYSPRLFRPSSIANTHRINEM